TQLASFDDAKVNLAWITDHVGSAIRGYDQRGAGHKLCSTSDCYMDIHFLGTNETRRIHIDVEVRFFLRLQHHRLRRYRDASAAGARAHFQRHLEHILHLESMVELCSAWLIAE